jgi:hypothetical protein
VTVAAGEPVVVTANEYEVPDSADAVEALVK